MPAPMAMPSRPPLRQSTTASMRNCAWMSRPRAPSALRRPISRVRSVTDTSMMFMMPMPPTTSEIAATQARKSERVCVIALKAWIICAKLRIW